METEKSREQPSAPLPDAGRPPGGDGRPEPLAIILEGRRAAGCDAPFIPRTGGPDRMDADRRQYLCVTIGGEGCAIRITEIREIVRPRPVTEIPGAPPFLPGVISLRGTIIPLLDTALRLGVRRPRPAGRERVVVVTGPAGLTGLLVERVSQVVRIADDTTREPGTVVRGIKREFVAGTGKSGDRTLLLLDVVRIADVTPRPGDGP